MLGLLGLLGLRIFEACGADIEHMGEEHGHRVLRVHGKGDKIVLTPLPPAVQRAIERAVADRRKVRSCSTGAPEPDRVTGTRLSQADNHDADVYYIV